MNCCNRAIKLFAIVCNSNFRKNHLALVQTLGHKNILLQANDTRESPDLSKNFKKNQRFTKKSEIAHSLQTAFPCEIFLQTFANENKIRFTHCNASKARQRVTPPAS
jgi:hypothetical protein